MGGWLSEHDHAKGNDDHTTVLGDVWGSPLPGTVVSVTLAKSPLTSEPETSPEQHGGFTSNLFQCDFLVFDALAQGSAWPGDGCWRCQSAARPRL